MFTQPVTAPTSPGLSVTSASATTVSPASPTSRSGRLRGLSYLRTYTQQHLLNRDSGSGSSTPTAAQQQSPVSHSSRNLLTRSISYTPTSSTTSPVSATPPTRPSAPEPTAGGAVTASSSSSTQATVAGGSSRTAVASTSASRTTNKRPAPQNESASDSERAPRTSMTRNRSATASDAASAGSTPLDILPSIRFSTFYDPRATRPSLTFTPVSRTLPTGGEVIRVGRYSERDTQQNVPTNVPSAAPVGFKSKVVSRRHCEFWYEEGKWYIKDVKSSSGTFLNHIRLSPPGTESKPFPVNDGDIVQLGIDFKGGEEMIFRCVKMRLELNRGWQNKLNTFNLTTHKRLRNMTMSGESGGAPQTSQDCSICLSSIAPCQCLFVAPCSHTWHYKCIRSLLTSPQYPIFICPNCRAAADLEAEVEDPEEWQQLGSDDGQASEAPAAETAMAVDPDETQALEVDGRPEPPQQQPAPASSHPVQHSLADSDMEIDPPSHQPPPPPPPAAAPAASSRPASAEDATMSVSHATSHPVPIPNAAAARRVASEDDTGNSTPTNEQRQTRTPSPVNGNPPPNAEGPITPRNDAGPWVFDGSGVRTRSGGAAAAAAGRASTDSRRGEMRSLDAAAEMLNQQN